MRVDQWFCEFGDISSDKPAIIFKDTIWSYEKLNNAIIETASFLQKEGNLKIGDRICFYGTNNPEQIILLLAASKIGVILSPLNWRLANPEIEFQVNHSKPKMIFYHSRFKNNLDLLNLNKNIEMVAIDTLLGKNKSLSERRKNLYKINNIVDNNLPVLLVYTSGTTGKPKGALLNQKALICNAKMSHHAHSLQSSDNVLVFLPLFHVGGINILLMPALFLGATVVLQEKFDPEDATKAIENYQITHIITVPTVLDQIINSKSWNETKLSSLRAISIGSTNVPLSLIKKVHEYNIPLIQIYGATETGPIAIYQTIGDALISEGSIGKKGLYCFVRLVNEKLEDVGCGEPGQILIKGDNILESYWEDKTSTKDSIIDGWFLTGDVAKVDLDGNYWFVDRIKNVIISGGENIYPAELETLLSKNQDLKEYSIVGRKDEKWGEVPVIVAVRKNLNVLPEEILKLFKGKVANYKIPKDVLFVKALPRNALGKIVIDEVKELAI